MTQRPWKRGSEDPGESPGPTAKSKREPWLNEPFHATEKTAEEIRAYCLEQIRGQLTTNVGGVHSEEAMLRASQFATIAEAFRPAGA